MNSPRRYYTEKGTNGEGKKLGKTARRVYLSGDTVARCVAGKLPLENEILASEVAILNECL